MATLTLYLDDRTIRKDGCAPVKLIIRNRGTTSHLPLGIAVPPPCWKDGKVVLTKRANVDAMLPARPLVLNNQISNLVSRITLFVNETCGVKGNMSASVIKDKALLFLAGKDPNAPSGDKTLVEAWEEYLDQKIKERSRVTMRNPLAHILKSVKKASSLRFDDIDEAWIRKWIKTMQDGTPTTPALATNTIHYYYGTFKTVWHYAQKKKYVSRDHNPYEDITVSTVATKSRALLAEDARKIWFYDETTDQEPSKAKKDRKVLARDLFRLMFCFCGINMADLHDLTEADIRNGRLETDRKKTGVHINIKVEPEAMEIINKYKKDGYLIGKIRRAESEYTLRIFNNALKELNPEYTSYWARHTWVSLSIELDTPDRTVFMGIAHSQGKRSDETYVTMRNRKLDLANRRVIDYVLGKIEPES